MSDTVNFDFSSLANAKEYTRPAAGKYEWVIDDYSLQAPKKEESKSKGFSIVLTLKLADPESARTDLGESDDFSNFKIKKYVWWNHENPINAVHMYNAIPIVGGDVSDTSVDLNDSSYFLGEKVGAVLRYVPRDDDKDKTRADILDDSWFLPESAAADSL